MASSQKKRCACPSLAAAPTQLEPTTKRICVRTRSPRPSGFLRAALCPSTWRSARSSSVVTPEIVGHAHRLPNLKHRQAERLPYKSRHPCRSNRARARAVLAALHFEIRGGEFSLQHRRCSRRRLNNLPQITEPRAQAQRKTLAI